MSKYAAVNVKFGADISQFSTAMQKAAREMKKAGDQLQSVGRSMTMNLTAPIVALGAAALYSFGQIDSLKRGLISFSGSAALAEEEFTKLREVAKLPGIGLEEAVRGSINLQAIGVNADDARVALKAFGNAIATVGGGKENFDLAIRGFGQLMNASKPLQQDLYQIANQLPQINKLMIEAFGTNRAEDLAKMGISGKQLADFLVTELGKLPQVSGGIKNAFENMSDSVKISLASFGEAIEKNFNISDKINQLSSFLSRLINSFSNLNPETQKFILGWVAIIAVIGPVLLGIGAMVNLLPTLMAGFGVLRGAVVLATTALKALSVAMNANWVVALIGVLVLAVVAMKNWGDSTSDTTKRLNEQREATKKLADEQDKLNNPLLNKKKANPLEDINLYGETNGGYANFRKNGFKGNGGGGEFTFMGDVNAPAKKIAIQAKATQEEIDKANKALADAKERQVKAWKDFYSVKTPPIKDLHHALSGIDKEFKDATDGNVKTIQTGWELRTEAFKKGIEGFTSQTAVQQGLMLQRLEAFTQTINDTLVGGVQDALINVAAAFGENLVDGDPFKDLGNVILSSLGKLMVALGSAMITFSTIFVAFKESISSLQPEIAIPLGIAMVAAGAAISKIAAKGMQGSSGSYSASSNPSSNSGSSGGNLTLTTRLDGRDLVMSGQNTSYVKRR